MRIWHLAAASVLTSAPVASAFVPASYVLKDIGHCRAAAIQHRQARLRDKTENGGRRSSVDLRIFRKLFGSGDNKKPENEDEDDRSVEHKEEDQSVMYSQNEGREEGGEGTAQSAGENPVAVGTEDSDMERVWKAMEDESTWGDIVSPEKKAKPEVESVLAVAAENKGQKASGAAVTESSKVAPAAKSAIDEAEQLRAAAQRVRLEAEKMDVMLTFDKIEKLEKELENKSVSKDLDRATAIRNQIESLKKKLSGESPAPSPAPTKPVPKVEDEPSMDKKSTERGSLVTATVVYPKVKPLSPVELQERVQKYEQSPKFMKEIIARTAGIDFMDIQDVNATALVIQLHEDEQKFLSIQEEVVAETPKFTQEQIDEKVAEVKQVPQLFKNFYGEDANNDTAIALKMLETEWESDRMSRKLIQAMDQNDEDEDTSSRAPARPSSSGAKPLGGSNLFGEAGFRDEKTDVENMVESLFPKSTRKEGTVPTEAQIKILMEDVMSKIKLFNPSGRAEAVPGGYLIRGRNQFDNGQTLIDAVDASIANSRVKDKVLVHFVADPTPVSEEQLMMGEREPLLYVTSTDIARDANRFLLAAVTSAGLATTWYTSLYPFLLNPTLMKKAEEQLTLANAGMEYDLNWLTDMGIPIFVSFLGVQIAHEAAHWAVAKSNKMQITLPTLVPSLVTGITTGITALKSPAKNKQELFDFAIVGPLTGIVLSLLLIYVGCGITTYLDAAAYANLPSLPLDVLRQSSLAGGIIESILGEGTLQVPAAAAGTQAIADINIALHPFAIAGFFSLLVNAINLVPFGRTDGGRVSLALFGRSGSQLVGLLSLITLFVAGLFSSDLLLFYFSFILFFQNEAEIPCRNEVDDIDFSRILLSTFTGILVALTLIPMS